MNSIQKTVVLACLIFIALSQSNIQDTFRIKDPRTIGISTIGSNSGYQTKTPDAQCCGHQTIKVSGRGEVSGSPDVAVLFVGVEQIADTTSNAIQGLNRKISSILNIARQFVLPADIETQAITTFPRTKFQDGISTVTGQIASQTISLKLRNIGTGGPVGNLIDRLSSVDGFTVSSINFELSNRDSLIVAARNNAFNDAKIKAQDYASAAGVRLGKVVNIDDNSFDAPTPQPFAEVAFAKSSDAASSTTINPQDLTISTEVTITYSFA